jgi:hypothetical protein
VNHVHLHCFSLPLSIWMYDKVVYGYLLKSIEDILKLRNSKL